MGCESGAWKELTLLEIVSVTMNLGNESAVQMEIEYTLNKSQGRIWQYFARYNGHRSKL